MDEAIHLETDSIAIAGLMRLKNAISNAETELPICMGVPPKFADNELTDYKYHSNCPKNLSRDIDPRIAERFASPTKMKHGWRGVGREGVLPNNCPENASGEQIRASCERLMHHIVNQDLVRDKIKVSRRANPRWFGLLRISDAK